MDGCPRGFRGRGGRRPWRGRPKTPRRSTENLSASGQDDTEETNRSTYNLQIYDSSEFEDNTEESRGRGRGRRSHFRGRGRGRESSQYEGRPRSESAQGRSGGRGYSRGQRSESCSRGERQVKARFMGYKRLEELSQEDDPDEVLLQLVTPKNGFEQLLEKQVNSDWMSFLVAILVKAYTSQKEQNCNELTKIMSSKQIVQDHLIPFVDKILYGVVSYDESKKIADLLRNLCRLTLVLFRNMQGSLPILKMFLEKLEKLVLDDYQAACEEFCPEIFSELEVLQEARAKIESDYIKRLEKHEKPKKYKPQPENQEPPDDFHDLSVLPTNQDLQFNKKPFLRANKTKGEYENLQQYLDIQFRLLREDYLHPLREGILDYRRELEEVGRTGRKRQTDIRIYENVEIIRPLCSKHGVRHIIKFDSTKLTNIRWESSRRLLYGSLLCLSADGFQSMIFATVTERKITDLQNGFIEVQFTDETQSFNLSTIQSYVMAETTAYFEAYRYILQGLQEVGNEMPLQSSIVHCKPNEKPPRYLLKGGHGMQYDFGPLLKPPRKAQVFVLNTKRWPQAKQIGMDDSQHKALQMAITKEIAIIQGPPGTGKTYVGLKIVHLLLHNKRMWTENVKLDPILVVCYTNHALDQFLVGILEYSEKLVRIGGRCKTEALEEFSLQNYRVKAREEKSVSRTIHEKKTDCIMNMKKCRENIEQVSGKLKCAKQGILRLRELNLFMNERHKRNFHEFSTENDMFTTEVHKATLDEWLGLKVNFSNLTESDEDKGKQNLMVEWEQELTNGTIIEKMEKSSAKFVKDPWQLNLQNRGALYKCLLREYQDSVSNKILVLTNKLQKIKKAKERARIQGGIDHLLSMRTKSEKFILSSKTMESDLPMDIQRILIMIRKQGDTLEWLCLDGSTESCSRIAGVLHNKYLDAKEEAEYEDEERRLEEEDIEDEELNFFSGYSKRNEKNESNVENLSETSVAILYREANSSENTGGWFVQVSRSKMEKQLKKILENKDIMKKCEADSVKDVWKLNSQDRQRLYRFWLNCYIMHMKESIREAVTQYDDLCRGYREVLDAEDVEIMRGADVIGMTTTGAAKYRNILQSIKPKIIIVEEAAEVLESHIVTTINSNCQHLILIGDHKQLRPTPTVYFLAKKYNLDISLFERMVNNDLNYVTLGIQHRMRPEISVLMKNENLYPDLCDHETVRLYEHVKGVISDVFFINHNEPETDHRETTSKSNIHEAKFVKRLCRYFLQQDYERSQITILTAYTGQILALKKEMPKMEFEGVHITSIDNFQGEENDIIILSLVRSNSTGSTGFLKIDNRICVSLSRARKGLFVIGNFDLLCSESTLWRYIVDTMIKTQSFGRSLVLQCGNHPKNSAKVSRDSDFDQTPNGGCSLPCSFVLNCSHKCKQLCHVSDPKHELYKCLQPCLKKCIKGHDCRRMCFQDCGECKVKVPKIIVSCGHLESVPCSVDEDQWSCKTICNEILPCAHKCKGQCGTCRKQTVHEKCQERCKKRLSCGHIMDVLCCEEEETLFCKEACKFQLECGHVCRGTCSSCQQGRLHIPCQSKCGRKLLCGHTCDAYCVEGCPPCDRKCRMSCYHKTCEAQCRDPCAKCTEQCSRCCEHQTCMKRCVEKCSGLPCSKNCSLKLRCGHNCMGICGEKCPEQCSECHLLTFQGSLNELEIGVRLLTLDICGHTFSVDSLDLYMFEYTRMLNSQVSSELICCPICSSTMTSNLRYKSVIEETRIDIETIKENIKRQDISSMQKKSRYIKEKALALKENDPEAVECIKEKLEETNAQPIERVNLAYGQMLILEIIYNIYQSILHSIIENTKEEKMIAQQLKMIRGWIFESMFTFTENNKTTHKHGKRNCFSKQELSDVRLELWRLAYLVQFMKLSDVKDKYRTKMIEILSKKVPVLESQCQGIRYAAKVFGNLLDEQLFEDLKFYGMSERYRIWQKGTWFKCKNGHITNTDLKETKCGSCDVVIGKKTLKEKLPPKMILSVPKPSNQKMDTVRLLSAKENKKARQVSDIYKTKKDKPKPLQVLENEKTSAMPKNEMPMEISGELAATKYHEKRVFKKLSEKPGKHNDSSVDSFVKFQTDTQSGLPWQKIDQKQKVDGNMLTLGLLKNPTEDVLISSKLQDQSSPLAPTRNLQRIVNSSPKSLSNVSLKPLEMQNAWARKIPREVQESPGVTARNSPPRFTTSSDRFNTNETSRKPFSAKDLSKFEPFSYLNPVKKNNSLKNNPLDQDVNSRQRSQKYGPIDYDIDFDIDEEGEAQVAIGKTGGNQHQEKESNLDT